MSAERLALVTGVVVNPEARARGYGRLELGDPVRGAPPCAACGNPASIELEYGPACRDCINAAWNLYT